ncbi:hypothetical protein, partial [Pseudomonas fluorescens]
FNLTMNQFDARQRYIEEVAGPPTFLNPGKIQNGALNFPCPFSGISYTENSLIPPFKTLIRNYGAEIATCDPSDTAQ